VRCIKVVPFIVLALCFSNRLLPAQGQGSPLPGASSYYAAGSSPLPGSSQTYQSDPSRAGGSQKNTSIPESTYKMLPVSLADAKLRIEELRNLVALSRPQDVQDKVNFFCEWLVDMTEAHNRLSNAFSKQDSLKVQAQEEKNTAQRFAHLKNEATLLKAEVLIKENRIPEAIGPLVDIVANEPKGSAGVAAYNRLKEIGFAEEAKELGSPVPTTQADPLAPTSAPVTRRDGSISTPKERANGRAVKSLADRKPGTTTATTIMLH
jgi:hypothetical protein